VNKQQRFAAARAVVAKGFTVYVYGGQAGGSLYRRRAFVIAKEARQKKMFFFEKKNQKTFASGVGLTRLRGRWTHSRTGKSSLLLSFKKEVLSSFEAIHANY
jgi:hypothetical protein